MTFHKYLSQITEVPAGAGVTYAGPITTHSSMTVDAGHLWIAEQINGTNNYRIDEFDAATEGFLAQLPQVPGLEGFSRGVAVGHATGEGEVYAGAREASTGNLVVAVFSEATGAFQAMWTGTPSGLFNERQDGFDVAVDNNSLATDPSDSAAGFVYVLDGGAVDVFEPEAGGKARYVTQITGTHVAGTTGEQFTAAGSFSEGIRHVAVDQSNGDLIVSNDRWIDVFQPVANMPGQYEFIGPLPGPNGITGPPTGPSTKSFGAWGINSIAVDGADGEIYAAEPYGFVYEFSASGAYLGRIGGEETPEKTFGEPGPGHGLSVDPATHRVFVGVYHYDGAGEAVDVFGSDVVVPDVETTAASSVEPESAQVNGEVNPDGAGAATCRFAVWSETLNETAPCEPEGVADGSGLVAVHADLGGLEPDTAYNFRLQASNANGSNPGEAWQARELMTPGPGLHGEWTTGVTAQAATLDAKINPHDAPTSYYFQYGTNEEYEAGGSYGFAMPASPGASIGSGEGDVQAAQRVSGLEPGAVYHYRVVALSELTAGDVREFRGPDRTFSTQSVAPASQLPDERAWELVSPADKHGAVLHGISEGVVQAAAMGGAVTYQASQPTEGKPLSYSNLIQVRSVHASSGWSSQDVALPREEASGTAAGQAGEYRFASTDLSLGVLEPFGAFAPPRGEAFPEATERTPLLRHETTCSSEPATCYEPLVTGASGYEDVPGGTRFGGETESKLLGDVQFLGSSADGTHVVLSSSVALTEESIGAGEALYEWSADRPATQRLQLVSVLPKAEGGGVVVNAGLGNDNSEDARDAISSDGSRVIFSVFKPGAGGDDVYLRDTARGETIKLGSGAYEDASADASRVFFSGQMCEVALNEAAELECPLKGTDGTVLGISEDGSYAYFLSGAVLGSAANSSGEKAQPGGHNVYVAHYDGTAWEAPLFVAALSAEDSPDWQAKTPARQPTRVSPDGRWLAFMSSRGLTGYDTADAATGLPDEEVYVYDYRRQTLACATCNPTGERPHGAQWIEPGSSLELQLAFGGEQWTPGQGIAANVPGWTSFSLGHALYQSRYLSDDGRLFFNSSDALRPQDVNGTQDVYEYEPPGVGSCTRSDATFSERDGGCVALVSSGASSAESAFLDAGEGGEDVFFLTRAPLSGQDRDSAYDVYDAHVCGSGWQCAVPAVAPLPCEAAPACKAQTPATSAMGTPESLTFEGVGDLAPPASTPKAPTRAQKLRRALRACRAMRSRRRRAACERVARRRYRRAASRRHARKSNRHAGR